MGGELPVGLAAEVAAQPLRVLDEVVEEEGEASVTELSPSARNSKGRTGSTCA